MDTIKNPGLTRRDIQEQIQLSLAVQISHGKSHTSCVAISELSAPYPACSVCHLLVKGTYDEDDNPVYRIALIDAEDFEDLYWTITDSNSGADLKAGIADVLKWLCYQDELWPDDACQKAWEVFIRIPVDEDTDEIQEEFLHFPAGTNQEIVHEWFDRMYSRGVYSLMHPGEMVQPMSEAELMVATKELIGSYVFLAEKEDVSREDVVDELGEIFSDANLRWLGYPEYCSENGTERDRTERDMDDEFICEGYIPLEDAGDVCPATKEDMILQCLIANGIEVEQAERLVPALSSILLEDDVPDGNEPPALEDGPSCEDEHGPCYACRACAEWYWDYAPVEEAIRAAITDACRHFNYSQDKWTGKYICRIEPLDDFLTDEEISRIESADEPKEALKKLVDNRWRDVAADYEDELLERVHMELEGTVYFDDGIPEAFKDHIRDRVRERVEIKMPYAYYLEQGKFDFTLEQR